MNELEERVRRSFSSQGLMATLGAELEHVGAGEVRIALPGSPGVSQQHGYVHAGAISSILDTACGYAAFSTAPPGYEVVTAEFKINFLRPAIGQRFLAVGRVVHAGQKLTVTCGEVLAFPDPQSECRVVAVMQATVVRVAITGPTDR